jgi:hypothetical protein
VVGGTNKDGVAKTKFAATAMESYGKASNELFMQFVARIAQEIPKATVAIFSTLKYINAPTLEKFRQIWSANYLGGSVVHNQVFEGLKVPDVLLSGHHAKIKEWREKNCK